jgi:hypothetical protein
VAANADLFICGIWSFDTPDPTFLDYQTLLRHLPELTAKRVILSHLGPPALARRDAITLEVAHEGQVIEL